MNIRIWSLVICAVLCMASAHAQKISELPSGTATGTSSVVIVESGTTFKTTVSGLLDTGSNTYQPLSSNLTTLASGTANDLSFTGSTVAINSGTGGDKFARGDDSRIVGALQRLDSGFAWADIASDGVYAYVGSGDDLWIVDAEKTGVTITNQGTGTLILRDIEDSFSLTIAVGETVTFATVDEGQPGLFSFSETARAAVNASAISEGTLAGSRMQAASASNAGAVTTGSQTIAGNKTLSGNLSVNGNTTLGDASGDTLNIQAGNVTAAHATGTSANSVANVGTLDLRYVAGRPLSRGRGVWDFSAAGGTCTNVGTGSGAPNIGGFRMQTGTTPGSSSLYRPLSNALTRFGRGNSVFGVDYARPVWLIWAGQLDLRSDGVFRVQLGRPFSDTTPADLVAAGGAGGIGFYLAGGEVKLELATTTVRTLSASLGTYSTSAAFFIDLKARSDGAGNVRVWINNVEVQPQTGGPTVGTGSTNTGVHLSVENGAGTTNALADICSGQFTIIVE
jgi:hypothetical protein